ncbi:MAG: hypothetical protein M1834_002383 [Cirrosporium novae-zelandiae]|nr:MAG: hypothetical protein M1834_002383 [Cirrosporium novae-zelandiae]
MNELARQDAAAVDTRQSTTTNTTTVTTTPGSTNMPACDQCRIRKVRCDRQYPECSNCKKAHVACDFSNRGKRPNVAKQLVDDFADLSSRLGHIDNAMLSMAERMDALTAMISTSIRTDLTPKEPLTELTPRPLTSQNDSIENRSNAFSDPQQPLLKSTPHIVVDENGDERFYGACSTLSLFNSAKITVERFILDLSYQYPNVASPLIPPHPRSLRLASLIAKRPSILDEVKRGYLYCPYPGPYREIDLTSDGMPLLLPPHSLLYTSLDLYCDGVSLEPPIFQKETFLKAIEQQYAPRLIQDCSYSPSSVDYETLTSLFDNCKRALQKLDDISRPRFVNVQALTSLALIARDCFPLKVFEPVFCRACQVAKSMGLQEAYISTTASTQEKTERRNLFWALFAMDKQRSLIGGIPCQLYLFESDIRLCPSVAAQDPEHIRASVSMACVMEEVYHDLYSSRAIKKTGPQQQENIRRLSGKMDAWWSTYHTILEGSRISGAYMIVSLQLRYIFHVVNVLVHRCGAYSSCNQRSLADARAAIRIIQLLRGSYFNAGGIQALEWLFRNYSIVAFYQLLDDFLSSSEPSRSSDLELLRSITNALGLVVDSKRPDSYCSRIYRVLMWYTNIASIIHNAEEGGSHTLSNLDQQQQQQPPQPLPGNPLGSSPPHQNPSPPALFPTIASPPATKQSTPPPIPELEFNSDEMNIITSTATTTTATIQPHLPNPSDFLFENADPALHLDDIYNPRTLIQPHVWDSVFGDAMLEDLEPWDGAHP